MITDLTTQCAYGDYLVIAQGGGYCGIEAHAGYLTAIYKAIDGFHIKYDGRGASAGALALAIAMTITPKAMINLIKATPSDDLMELSWGELSKLVIPGVDNEYVYGREGMEEMIKNNVDIDIVRNRLSASVTDSITKESYLIPVNSYEVLFATSAIPQVFKHVDLYLNGVKKSCGDGGVGNNIPTIRINDIAKYKHIFILLTPDEKYNPYSWYQGKLSKAVTEISATGLRETNTVQYEWQPGKSKDDILTERNITIFCPPQPPFETSVMGWSDNNQMIKYCQDYAEKILTAKQNVFI